MVWSGTNFTQSDVAAPLGDWHLGGIVFISPPSSPFVPTLTASSLHGVEVCLEPEVILLGLWFAHKDGVRK